MTPPDKIDFETWWQRFMHCAEEVDWPTGNDAEAYREYYDDGDSPEEALATEMSYADDGDFE